MTLRLTGVYDLRTIKKLQEKKVNHIAFDFRPRSLNFIQEHLCLKIIKSTSFDNIYLQFENEKAYIIEHIYKSIRDNFEGNVFIELFNNSIDMKDVNYPFIYNIENTTIPSVVLKNEMLCGYSIESSFLSELKERGQFDSWLRDFYSAKVTASRQMIHILSRDWDDDIFPSLFELLDFDIVSLPVNSKVEKCFRNVDLIKLSEQLKYISQ